MFGMSANYGDQDFTHYVPSNNSRSNLLNSFYRTITNTISNSSIENKTNDVNEIISSEKYIDLENIKEKGLECPICLNVINGTVVYPPCLHKFCSSCLTKSCLSSANPSCPLCRESIPGPNDIILCEELTNYLDNCVVKCKNLECSLTFKRTEYKDHSLICEYNKESCKFCNNLFYTKSINEHKSICHDRTVSCEKCNVNLKFNKLNSHIENHCAYSIVKCTFNSCNFKTEKYLMALHMTECEYRNIYCHCGYAYIYSKKNEHLKICNSRKISCRYCNNTVIYSRLTTHYNNCPEKLKQCYNCTLFFKGLNYEKHLLECPEKMTFCKNHCNIEVLNKNMDEHLKVCFRRVRLCEKCNSYYNNEIIHKRECTEETVKCKYCNISLTLKNLYIHENICPEFTLPCKYSYAKCTEILKRKDMKNHNIVNSLKHVNLLEKYILNNIHPKINHNDVDEDDDGGYDYRNYGINPRFPGVMEEVD